MRKDKIRRLTARIMKGLYGTLPSTPTLQGPFDSIVILAQEKIGDALLLTPLIGNLRALFPDLRIHVVAYGPIEQFFIADSNITMVHQGKQPLPKFLSEIRRYRFDVLFNTKDHPSNTFLLHSRLIAANCKVGISHPYHTGLFNKLLDITFEEHVVRKNCSILGFLSHGHATGNCQPYLPEGRISAEIITFVKTIRSRNVIGINMSAGEPAREWSLSKWEQLISRLNVPLILISMPERLGEKQYLESRYGHVLKSPPTASIHDAAEIIKNMQLLVSPDTSLIHLASCFSTPVVGMYRNNVIHLTRFAPWLIPHRQIISPVDKIEAIEVDEVLHAVISLSSSLTESRHGT